MDEKYKKIEYLQAPEFRALRKLQSYLDKKTYFGSNIQFVEKSLSNIKSFVQ